MNELKTEKLSVEFRSGITPTEPIIPRRYTLTHNDMTGDLYLTIGATYAYDKITAMRDEVLGEWIKAQDKYIFYAYLYVSDDYGSEVAAMRNYIFRHELPLALKSIRYGDNDFFYTHSELNSVPIIVYFSSAEDQYNKIENWGTFSDYSFVS